MACTKPAIMGKVSEMAPPYTCIPSKSSTLVMSMLVNVSHGEPLRSNFLNLALTFDRWVYSLVCYWGEQYSLSYPLSIVNARKKQTAKNNKT